jgi:uncharacterized membrane protein
MDLYHAILFIHVGSATVWLGSAAVLELLEWQIVHASSRERLKALIEREMWFGPRIFIPAGLSTVFSGLALIFLGGMGFSRLWVIVALLGVAGTAVIGVGVLGRAALRLSSLVENPASSEEEIHTNLVRLKVFAQIDLAILVWILFDMVMKPDASNVAFFVLSTSFFVVVALYAGHRLYVGR